MYERRQIGSAVALEKERTKVLEADDHAACLRHHEGRAG
jgi:hypothetical protein